MSNLWDDAKRPCAQAVIQEIMPTRLEKGGWRWNLIHVLRVRALSAWSKGESLPVGDVVPTLTRMHDNKQNGADDFEAAQGDIIAARRQAANRNQTRWQFFLPLGMKPGSGLSLPIRAQVMGSTFHILPSWNLAKRQIGASEFTRLLKQIENSCGLLGLEMNWGGADSDPCLTFCGNGDSFRAAWAGTESCFDVFRGILELPCGLWRMNISSGPHAWRRFPPPAWLMAIAPGHAAEEATFHVEPQRSYGRQEMPSESWNMVKRCASLLKAVPTDGSTCGLIADSLRLYIQAMDARFRHVCLLGLWQMAERLTLASRHNGNPDLVCRRLAISGNLWRDHAHWFTDVLKPIARKRNQVVHRGIHGDVDDMDANILKLACEKVLVWLMGAARRLREEDDIEFYYLCSQKAPKDRTRMERCLRMLRRPIAGRHSE